MAKLPGLFKRGGTYYLRVTQSGLARAKAEGKSLGRPRSLADKALADVNQRLAAGESVASIAKTHRTSRQTIMRARNTAGAEGQQD